MASAYDFIDRRHEHWILASMLLILHASIEAGLESSLSAALMTTHLGLFFLWQPIWQRDQQLQPRAVIIIALLVGIMLATLSWWSLFVWLILLIGIVAGRSFSTRKERFVYMLSLAFLVSELLVSAAPHVFFGQPLVGGVARVFQVGLYVLPLVLYAIPPITAPQRDPFAVDFFRGITFALLTALLAAFSVLITFRFGIEYPIALVFTLMALGLLLLFLSWLAAPGSGNTGVMTVWEKSVLNIGTPFESWLSNIANLAAQQHGAEDFLEGAILELNDIPWVAGVEWRSGNNGGFEGHRSRHHLKVNAAPLDITLYTERSFSSALLMHCHLLIQVLGHFYVAKQRENEEANQAHLRAIFETGARVTHDIKNLLQSLETMAGSLDAANTPEQEHRGFELLRRRLPDVADRLRRALEKLQRPSPDEPQMLTAAAWWARVDQRYADSAVTLERTGDDTAELPGDCFDSVVDNLVDNARNKIAAGEARALAISFHAADGEVAVAVSDDGAALPAALARQLFQHPVESDNGLGIGLYQAARQAELAGCELSLASNRDGAVSFRLRYPGPAQLQPAHPGARA